MVERGSMVRHRWGPKIRPDPNHTHQECECGMVKMSRHEGDRHWIEYWDGDAKHEKAPPCFRDKERQDESPRNPERREIPRALLG